MTNIEQTIIFFDTGQDETNSELHKMLCKAIHERDPRALDWLQNNVMSIQYVGTIDTTNISE